MVRLKSRYMLVNILYPEIEKSQSKQNVPDVVAFNQPTTDELTVFLLLKAIRNEVSGLFGDYGCGAISDNLAVKYLSPATSTFILRVSRAHYRIVWAALSLMTSIPVRNGKNCMFRVVRVSGTIRLAQNEAIRRARELILKAKNGQDGKSDSILKGILGKGPAQAAITTGRDIMEVDRSDSEEDLDMSDGSG